LASSFVPAEEENVATLDLLGLPYQTDMKYPFSDGLSVDRTLKFLPVWLVVEDAEYSRMIAVVENAGRPIDKLGEVEKKRRLDLVFLKGGLALGRWWQAWNEQYDP
jgi:hypothetical protein